MKPSALLVNVARGPIVDQAALVDALREERLGGAGVDVVEPEPLPVDDPLLSAPNVIGAPHALGYSDELFRECVEQACRSLIDVAAGRVPETSRTRRWSKPRVPRISGAAFGRERDAAVTDSASSARNREPSRAAPPARGPRGAVPRRRRPSLRAHRRDRARPSHLRGGAWSNWDTVPGAVSNSSWRSGTTVRRRFHVRHARNDIDFAWHGTISGDELGRTGSFEGRAERVSRTTGSACVSITRGARRPGARIAREHRKASSKGSSRPDRDAGDRRRRVPCAVPGLRPARRPARRRRIAALRVRRRSVGDRGSPQLDRRELQDVLDADLARFPARVGSWRDPRAAARRDPERHRSDRLRRRPAGSRLAHRKVTRVPAIGLGLDSDGHVPGEHEAELIGALGPAHVRVEVRSTGAAGASALARGARGSRSPRAAGGLTQLRPEHADVLPAVAEGLDGSDRVRSGPRNARGRADVDA